MATTLRGIFFFARLIVASVTSRDAIEPGERVPTGYGDLFVLPSQMRRKRQPERRTETLKPNYVLPSQMRRKRSPEKWTEGIKPNGVLHRN